MSLRPDLLRAQRGEGPLAVAVHPLPSERVLEVPQAYSHLMSPHTETSVLGLPVEAIDRYVDASRYGAVRWKTYDPQHDPGWGYGLLVVRDGVLLCGPSRWDSS